MTKPDAPKSEAEEALERYRSKVEKWIDPNRWFPRQPKPSPDDVRFVGFNDRMFSGVIDISLIFLLLYPLLEVLTRFFYREYNPEILLRELSYGGDIARVLESPEAREALYALVGNHVAQIAVLGAVFVGFWSYSSATPGKWLLRMRIVDVETGEHPTTKQFVIRFLACLISPLIAGLVAVQLVASFGFYLGGLATMLVASLGFFWIGWDKEKQGWHDKIAGTVVVKVRHWRVKPSGGSEFPDSWFEEEESAPIAENAVMPSADSTDEDAYGEGEFSNEEGILSELPTEEPEDELKEGDKKDLSS